MLSPMLPGPARLLPPRAGSGRAELRAERRSGGGARGPAPLSSLDLGRRALHELRSASAATQEEKEQWRREGDGMRRKREVDLTCGPHMSGPRQRHTLTV